MQQDLQGELEGIVEQLGSEHSEMANTLESKLDIGNL
jgi:hypothetical protein